MSKNKKKVLVFAPDSIHVKKFIDMVKDEVDVHLVINNPSFDYAVATTILKRDILMPWRILKILKRQKPDYIHIHTINRVTPLVLWVRNFTRYKNIPAIISAWGSSVLFEPWENRFKKKIVQYSLNACDVVTVDASVERYIVNTLAKDKKTIHYINFGVHPPARMRSMEEKEKIIYSPRGHHNIYNIGKIIESFAEFHKNNPDWKLYLSGTEHPENTPRYKKRVAELNLSEHVHFLGFVSQDENAEILARSKIMVSVPVSDGRAHSVMEAMGAGCVCFVSDIPTNYELIAHGVNGFLVEDHHLIDFAQYDSLDYDFLKKFNATKASGFTIENSKQCFLQLYK